jgi:hypothetical protein
MNRNKFIAELYLKNKSSNEIYQECNFGISLRQIQRIIKQLGLTRSKSDAFNLAISSGRMKYTKKPIEFLRGSPKSQNRYPIFSK